MWNDADHLLASSMLFQSGPSATPILFAAGCQLLAEATPSLSLIVMLHPAAAA